MNKATVENCQRGDVVVELVASKTLIRQHCTICGGRTERVNVLAEARIHDGDLIVRVCETCLKLDNIDEQLDTHAKRLASGAKYLRSIMGLLVLPTYAEWEKRNAELEAEYERQRLESQKPYPQCGRGGGSFDKEIDDEISF